MVTSLFYLLLFPFLQKESLLNGCGEGTTCMWTFTLPTGSAAAAHAAQLRRTEDIQQLGDCDAAKSSEEVQNVTGLLCFRLQSE